MSLKSFFLLLLTLIFLPSLTAQESDRIFPAETLGYFSVSSVKELVSQWEQTQTGKMLAAPKMEPFLKSFAEEIKERFSQRIGLTFEEIKEIPAGEIAGGLVAETGKMPGYVLLFNVAGKEKETLEYLDRLTNSLVGLKKAKKASAKIGAFSATKITVSQKNTLESIEKDVYFLLVKDYLIVSAHPTIAELIAKRILGAKEKPLAEKTAFQATQERCAKDRKESSPPLIRYYIEPLQFGEATRAMANLSPAARKKQSAFSVLAEEGFDALKGIGGTVDFKASEKDFLHRTFVYAPKPYRDSMKMISFINSLNFDIPDWASKNAARNSIWHVEPIAIFDNFAPLFDAFAARGEKGAWNDVYTNLRDDPQGPQIDLREEFVAHFGKTIYGVTLFQLPITTESEQMLVGIQLKEGGSKAVADALIKLFQDETGNVEKCEFQLPDGSEIVIWQTVQQETTYRPDGGIPGIPELPGGLAPNQFDTEENEEPLFPKGGVTTVNDVLFFSSDVVHLKKVLSDAVADSDFSFDKIKKAFDKEGISDLPRFFQMFARTDITTQMTYELLREGKMPQSESILGRSINALFFPEEAENAVPRKAFVDGSKMPAFDEIRHFFGSSGLYGEAEETGFFIKGFSLAP